MADSVLTLVNYTGFNKVAYLMTDVPFVTNVWSAMSVQLQEQGLEKVYENAFPPDTFDFSSYFAAIEASGAEILVPAVGIASIAFVKEYNDRQSPFVVWGNIAMAEDSDYWETTDGKCEFISFFGYPSVSGYPLTGKTMPFREAYIEKWGEIPGGSSAHAFNLVRFILPDAIRRAGSIDYEQVIAALEETNIETTDARHWVFTSTHDVMVGEAGPNNPGEDYLLHCNFQWQNGVQVPVYPKGVLEEAGATYTFPDWPGPWDNP